MKCSAKQIYDKLINEDGILTAKGQIKFFFDDLEVLVKKKDVVGNIMQEWVEAWLKKNDVEYSENPNTQMPPDFYLNPTDFTHSLLEVKAFNYEASPGFDIADFKAFATTVLDEPYMLDVDYLIFGYVMNEGIVTVKKVWLKKVWEITSPMKKWGVKVQEKKNVIYKLRPAKWYAKRMDYPIFRSMEDYISALEQTIYDYPDTRSISVHWADKLVKNYENFSGTRLEIKRWQDICDQYCWHPC